VSTRERTPLQVRHEAALTLVQKGELDPYEAIALVCWPAKGSRLESVPADRQYYSEATKEEARQLHAEGLTCPQVAARLGVPFPTVKCWLWNTTEKKREYRLRLREKRKAETAGEAGRLC
jgi:hypothetical protein